MPVANMWLPGVEAVSASVSMR